jgi:DNA-binding LacI/PurR family transcriptional regulator
MAQYFTLPLTSARLDFEQLGDSAMWLILDRIEGSETVTAGTLPSVLAVRESPVRPRRRRGALAP